MNFNSDLQYHYGLLQRKVQSVLDSKYVLATFLHEHFSYLIIYDNDQRRKRRNFFVYRGK